MKKKKTQKKVLSNGLSESYGELSRLTEEKLVNLFIRIIVSKTLKELYEKGDKISKVQSDWTE